MGDEFRFLMYKAAQEDITVRAVIKDESIWLTQKAMAELFGVQPPAISKHLRNIFAEGELKEEMVISKMEITTNYDSKLGKTQNTVVNFYNLDAIISVGYRVNSHRATRFRIWATNVLREYMIKGFAMDVLSRVKPPLARIIFENCLSASARFVPASAEFGSR